MDIHSILEWYKEANEYIPHVSRYHREDFYTHVLYVTYNACKNTVSRPLALAALLHDQGKPATWVNRPGKGNTFYDHQKVIAPEVMISKADPDYRVVKLLVESHMLPFTMAGPDPWASEATQQYEDLVNREGKEFAESLAVLHDADIAGSFTQDEDVPSRTDIEFIESELIQIFDRF